MGEERSFRVDEGCNHNSNVLLESRILPAGEGGNDLLCNVFTSDVRDCMTTTHLLNDWYSELLDIDIAQK